MGHKRTRLPNPGDRISALPEPIIHHILSFLPHKDVKVTSSLSKSWYQISTICPYFDFDGSPFKHYYEPTDNLAPLIPNNFNVDGSPDFRKSYPYFDYKYPPFKRYFKPWKHDRDMYVDYVTRTFDSFHKLNLQIERLTIPIKFSPRIAPLLDRCISLVLQREIQELNLDIRQKEYHIIRTNRYYNLPPPVFAAKSIKEAKIGGCNLLQSFPCGSTSNLLKLHLDNVLLDDQILSLIISTCPLIEELSITWCVGIKCFQISNLSKLKTLRISYGVIEEETTPMVEIDAPSLQSLTILGLVMIRALECPKLTHLNLDYVMLEDRFKLQDFLLRLSFLRSLCLTHLSSLTKLKMSSDTLHNLRVVDCDDLVELKCDAPNLRSLYYNGYYSLLPLSMHKVMARWDGYNDWVDPNGVNPISLEDFFVLLRNFVSNKGKHSENLNLYLRNIPHLSFAELNKRDVRPVGNISHLQLYVIKYGSDISYPDLLDCLLWSCHPRVLSLPLDRNPFRNNNNKFVKRICEVIMCRPRCFPCKLARSWLHCLEDVKYVTEDGKEDRLPMDGILVPYLCPSYSEIKFMFKW